MRASRFPFFTVVIFLLLVSWPLPAKGTETIVVEVVLNGQAKGEFFVGMTKDHDFLMREKDLRAIGFRRLPGRVTEIEGEPCISLRSMKGVTFVFDAKNLALEITASPDLLPKQTIDLAALRHRNVLYPTDTSAFFNYRLDYFGGNSLDFRSFDTTTEFGFRKGGFLFLTDSTYTRTPDDDSFVRLMSSLTYDWREQKQRLIVGDVAVSSGDLGSSAILGGVSFSKVYRIDPYFISYPTAGFSGLVSLPSDVDVYVNGMRIRRERLSPGAFDLRDLSYYGGVGVVSVVIQDAFGRTEGLYHPFYFTTDVLREGLHDYSYNAGFLREGYGSRSNDYGEAAFSAFHRYGISDHLTAGFHAEGAGARYNLGPQVTYLLPWEIGIVSLSLSGSLDGGRGGGAALASYSYEDHRVSARVLLKGYSKEYATIAEVDDAQRTKYEADAGFGYGTREFGNVSVGVDAVTRYLGEDRITASLSYSRNLRRDLRFYASARRIRDEESSNQFFVGLTYYPWRSVSASLDYRRENGADKEELLVQNTPPVGEGFGFRGSLERDDSPDGSSTIVNPYLQYNTKYAILTGEYRGQFRDEGRSDQSYNFSASGGIAYVGRTMGFSRPITDSFGLVEVGSLQGVRVYQNNQEIGRTDAKGKVFVPNMGSYFENQLSINDKDIPIDYSISEVMRYVSPPLRSGAVVAFPVKKFQAISGFLEVRVDGTVKPVDYVEVRMEVGKKEVTFPTGKGGEIYLENIPPGRYSAEFPYKGKTCTVEITIPASKETIVDLGELVCEDIR